MCSQEIMRLALVYLIVLILADSFHVFCESPHDFLIRFEIEVDAGNVYDES
jgi:hypothetical protein